MPTLRENKRYILFEVISERPILDVKGVTEAITRKALEFLGELGMARADIKTLSDTWNSGTQRGVVCVSHDFVDEARSVLMLVTMISNTKVTIKTIKTSGVINKLIPKDKNMR